MAMDSSMLFPFSLYVMHTRSFPFSVDFSLFCGLFVILSLIRNSNVEKMKEMGSAEKEMSQTSCSFDSVIMYLCATANISFLTDLKSESNARRILIY